MSPQLLRNLPSVGELLASPPLRSLVDRLSHNVVVQSARSVLDELRAELQTVATERALPAVSELAERIARRITQRTPERLRPAINATGTLVHDGLGRAPLADAALDAVALAGRDNVALAVDASESAADAASLAIAPLMQQLVEAEDSLVVNNGTAAALVTLAALAAGREVVVAAADLVEVDANCRLPDVIAASGARLRTVGTANRTRIDDYRAVCNAQTALIWKVYHQPYSPSAEVPSLDELVALGRSLHVPVVHQLGWGAIVDLAAYGLSGAPQVIDSVRAGAELVLISGDKLLGGPAAGIVAGKRASIDRITQHPLTRAVALDKLRAAALVATLELYSDRVQLRHSLPLVQLLDTPIDNLKLRASRLVTQLAALDVVASAEAIDGEARLCAGLAANFRLPTVVVAIKPAEQTAQAFAKTLASGIPAVVGRVEGDKLMLDLRTVFARQDAQVVAAVAALGRTATAASIPPVSEQQASADAG